MLKGCISQLVRTETGRRRHDAPPPCWRLPSPLAHKPVTSTCTGGSQVTLRGSGEPRVPAPPSSRLPAGPVPARSPRAPARAGTRARGCTGRARCAQPARPARRPARPARSWESRRCSLGRRWRPACTCRARAARGRACSPQCACCCSHAGRRGSCPSAAARRTSDCPAGTRGGRRARFARARRAPARQAKGTARAGAGRRGAGLGREVPEVRIHPRLGVEVGDPRLREVGLPDRGDLISEGELRLGAQLEIVQRLRELIELRYIALRPARRGARPS
eukprot:scaffold5639_cov63-Phaeocystis_antarctica.AAC.2